MQRVACVARRQVRHASSLRLGGAKKKKIALVVGFDGSYFAGSQLGDGGLPSECRPSAARRRAGGTSLPHTATPSPPPSHPPPTAAAVDGVLLHALSRSGLLHESQHNDLAALRWSRASRTDRGVHGLGYVVTVKVWAPDEWYDATRHAQRITDAVNAHLPPYVRVWDAAKVTKSFSARHDATSRVYQYLLPLSPIARALEAAAAATANRPPAAVAAAAVPAEGRGNVPWRWGHWAAAPVPPHQVHDRGALDALHAVLAGFQGTHPFHNFTLPSERAALVKPARGPADDRSRAHPYPPPTADSPLGSAAQFARVLGNLFPAGCEGGIAHDGVGSAWQLHPDAFRTVYRCGVAGLLTVTAPPGDVDSSALHLAYDTHRDITPLATTVGLPGLGGALSRQTLQAVEADARGPFPYLRAAAGAGAAAAPAGGWQERFAVLTVEGSGFMLHQVRHMVGTAVAEWLGALPPGTVERALTLPLFPMLPRAPAGGLMQHAVHWRSDCGVSWCRSPGADDEAVPQPYAPLQATALSSQQLLPGAMPHQSPADLALMSRDALRRQSAFFASHVLPTLLIFAGRECRQPSPAVRGVVVDAASAVNPRGVSTLAQTPPPWSPTPSDRTTPVAETMSAWLAAGWTRAEWASVWSDDRLAQWARAHATWRSAESERRAAAWRDSACKAATTLWAREQLAPPALTAPVDSDGERPSARTSTSVPAVPARLQLAEVSRQLLPAGLHTALALATGISHHGQLAAIARAVAWRISINEWPPVASAEQHAGWVAGGGASAPHPAGNGSLVAALLREGTLLATLEATEATAALQTLRRADRVGSGDRSADTLPPAASHRLV
jgi:tRNA pseudouridine(38-40) synthase